MPTVTSIQTGSRTIVEGDGQDVTETITSVNTSRTIVMVTSRNTDSSGRLKRYEFQAELTNSTTITFRRNQSQYAGTVYLEYTVVEFASGEVSQIQKGSSSISSDPSNVTLSPSITIADSVPIWHLETGSSDGTPGNSPIPTVSFTSGTNLEFDYDAGVTPNSANIAYYYVVEFNAADVTVQTGEINISASSEVNTATITGVDRAKTVMSHGGSRTSANRADRQISQLHFTADTTVEASRNDTGSVPVALDARYHVVEFLDNVTVEVGESTVSDTASSVNPTFTELGADSCVWNANWFGNAFLNSASSGTYTNLLFSLLLGSPPDDLTIERVGTYRAIETAYYLPDFAAAAAAPFLPYYDKRPDVLLRM